MALEGFGDRIKAIRQERGFTQKQLANLLGVTEQAVSKYERGNSYPDITMLNGISEVLDCSLDYLFQYEPGKKNLIKQDSLERKTEINRQLLPDIVTLKFAEKLVPVFLEESKQGFPHINEMRQQAASHWGVIIPPVRVMDELSLVESEFEICIHGVSVYKGMPETVDENGIVQIVQQLKNVIFNHIGQVLNNQSVYFVVENLRDKYPYVAEGIVPEKISYSKLRQVMICLLKDGYTASPLIRIIEIWEESTPDMSAEEYARLVEKNLGEGFQLENWIK